MVIICKIIRTALVVVLDKNLYRSSEAEPLASHIELEHLLQLLVKQQLYEGVQVMSAIVLVVVCPQRFTLFIPIKPTLVLLYCEPL